MGTSQSTKAAGVEWVVTTQTAQWRRGELAASDEAGLPDVFVRTDRPRQPVAGFGATFNELGWIALAALDPETREGVLRELFAPGVGANFTHCRMPLGANDLARGWYSYDEVAGDFPWSTSVSPTTARRSSRSSMAR